MDLSNFEPRRHVKSIIYGGLDGIITIFAMVASTSGAQVSATILLIIGFANLAADALSMSVSDYLSSKAETDCRKSRESSLLHKYTPADRKKKIMEYYKLKGFSEQDCENLAAILSKDKKTSLDIIMAMEDDENEGSAFSSAFFTFGSFVMFGFIPLLTFILSPYFQSVNNFWLTSVLTLLTLGALGAMKSKFTFEETPVPRFFYINQSSIEMIVVGGSSAAISYGVAALLWNWFQVEG